ncbi:hypothetical protein ACJX0J_028111, partial [Zea mays]
MTTLIKDVLFIGCPELGDGQYKKAKERSAEVAPLIFQLKDGALKKHITAYYKNQILDIPQVSDLENSTTGSFIKEIYPFLVLHLCRDADIIQQFFTKTIGPTQSAFILGRNIMEGVVGFSNTWCEAKADGQVDGLVPHLAVEEEHQYQQIKGGLGIKNLDLQNKCLMSKMEFGKRYDLVNWVGNIFLLIKIFLWYLSIQHFFTASSFHSFNKECLDHNDEWDVWLPYSRIGWSPGILKYE